MSSDRNLSEIRSGIRTFHEGFFNDDELIEDILRELYNGERIFIAGVRTKSVPFGGPEYFFFLLTDLRIIEYSRSGDITIYEPKNWYYTKFLGKIDLCRKDGYIVKERLELNFDYEDWKIFDKYFERIFEKRKD